MTRSALAPAHRLALVLAMSLSAGWLALTPVHADPRILAKVDGAPITEDDVADALHDIGPGLPQKLEGAAREKYVLDYLIDLRLVAAKSKADKLDQGADFTRQLSRQVGDGGVADPSRQGRSDRGGRAQGL
jgi:peptidyl-prolyl cis-trans isomerase C